MRWILGRTKERRVNSRKPLPRNLPIVIFSPRTAPDASFSTDTSNIWRRTRGPTTRMIAVRATSVAAASAPGFSLPWVSTGTSKAHLCLLPFEVSQRMCCPHVLIILNFACFPPHLIQHHRRFGCGKEFCIVSCSSCGRHLNILCRANCSQSQFVYRSFILSHCITPFPRSMRLWWWCLQCLILTILGFIPGLVYAVIMVGCD